MDLLSEDVRELVAKSGSVIRYEDKQLIHSRGDQKPGISIVVSGAVQVGVLGSDGTFLITSNLGPGQTFGEFTLFANLPRTHDISATGDTQVNQIAAGVFLRLYDEQPEVSRALLTTSLVRTHRLLEIMDAMRRLPIRERTAKVLLTTLQTAGSDRSFEYRQTELADALGISRTSLSTALRQLRELGLIETGYGQIRVPEPDRLQRWVAIHCGGI